MTVDQQLAETITHLLNALETLESQQTATNETLADLDKQVTRMAKELYKTNLMAEAAADEKQQTIEQLQTRLAQADQEAAQRVDEARLHLLEALLPIIDSIEAGIRSGVKEVKRVHTASPTAARLLFGWLRGQRLLRERLLNMLAAEGVQRMRAAGQPFDPYHHVAVEAVSAPHHPPGIVLKVERPGYIYGDQVLRYADVIVNKPREGNS